MLRAKLRDALTTAMKEKDQVRVATMRMIMSSLKSRDIDARTSGNKDGIDDAALLGLLQNMIKLRRESIVMYTQGGRPELAQREEQEIGIIQAFLPKPLSDTEVEEAIDAAVDAVCGPGEGVSIKDMGKVMAYMKERYVGVVDFSALGPRVKDRLSAGARS